MPINTVKNKIKRNMESYMTGNKLTDYTSDELQRVFIALGSYLVLSQSVTQEDQQTINQFRVKLIEAGHIVRKAENVINN